MNGIRLVTRADDAGLHPLINRAIRETVARGIVRNVSLMAPAPAIRNAWDVLGDLSDRVDFGLHVTLTAEWQAPRWSALTGETQPAGFLRPDGTMHFSESDLADASPNLDEILNEVGAQYDLLTGMGFELRYLDEHMAIGNVPGLAERLGAFAREKGLVCSRALVESGRMAPLPGWSGPEEHPGTELADVLSQTAGGTYLLVGHPANKDQDIRHIRLNGQAPDIVVLKRNRERRMFMDIEILDYCENSGIETLRYSNLEN